MTFIKVNEVCGDTIIGERLIDVDDIKSCSRAIDDNYTIIYQKNKLMAPFIVKETIDEIMNKINNSELGIYT